MPTTPEELQSTLREAAATLDRFGEPTWAATVRRVATKADAAWRSVGQSEGARVVLGLFEGGMGGFEDIVLHKDGRVATDAQDRFDSLRRILFEQARDAL